MIHIIGSPRSGTTIISQCLNAHSQICIPHDLDISIPISCIVDRVKSECDGKKLVADYLVAMDSYDRSLGEYIDRSEIGDIVNGAEYAIASIVNAILFIVARKNAKQIFGYKSTKNIDQVAVLALRGEAPKSDIILHIVRDGRDVASSLIKLGWVNPATTLYGYIWSSENILINKLLRAYSNYRLIRYEDFVLEPETCLNDICHLIGVAYESSMVNSGRRSDRYLQMKYIHERIYSNINGQKIGSWRKLAPALKNRIVNQTFEGVHYFEYCE